MSAFIVSDAHINYLVNGALRVARKSRGTFRWSFGNPSRSTELREENAQEVAQMLLNENYRSVNARYSESDETHSVAFKFLPWGNFDPVQLLKAISCYEYQTCEHEEWEESEARAFCLALTHWTISTLPGYSDAKWTIDAEVPV